MTTIIDVANSLLTLTNAQILAKGDLFNNLDQTQIKIGKNPEFTQAENTILLNATGSNLSNTVANSFVIKPIRDNPVSTRLLSYNPVTGEVIASKLDQVNYSLISMYRTRKTVSAVINRAGGFVTFVPGQARVITDFNNPPITVSPDGRTHTITAECIATITWQAAASGGTTNFSKRAEILLPILPEYDGIEDSPFGDVINYSADIVGDLNVSCTVTRVFHAGQKIELFLVGGASSTWTAVSYNELSILFHFVDRG
jgi:hypothetical protein